MTDLQKLAELYQSEGERIANRATCGNNTGFDQRDVPRAADHLTIAAHLRDAAEREKTEAAREHYATRFADRVFGKSVPQQMQEAIDAITAGGPTLARPLEDYAPGEESQPQEQAGPPTPDDHGVHMAHCNFGEYEGSCKYGDDNCPAFPAKAQNAIITLEAAITYPGSRVSDLLIGGEKVQLSNFALGLATVKDAKVEPPLSPPKDPRAPAPARLRDELETIVSERDYSLSCFEVVGRILDALIEGSEKPKASYYAGAFLIDVKDGKL